MARTRSIAEMAADAKASGGLTLARDKPRAGTAVDQAASDAAVSAQRAKEAAAQKVLDIAAEKLKIQDDVRAADEAERGRVKRQEDQSERWRQEANK